MPRATNNINDTIRVDLLSCPGGFVVLRRMSYGQRLKRDAMTVDMSMRQQGKERVIDIEAAQEEVTCFEFASCIAEHNLEDEHGNLLRFGEKYAVVALDARIGAEISAEIEKLHDFQADLGNSAGSSSGLPSPAPETMTTL